VISSYRRGVNEICAVLGPMGCPETSVRHYMLREFAKESSCQVWYQYVLQHHCGRIMVQALVADLSPRRPPVKSQDTLCRVYGR
jgi:hypothetical protein